MNKINVLFDNSQFKNLIDYTENYEFVSDTELSTLLRNANMTMPNVENSSTSRASSKRSTTTVPKRIFSPHPKRITEESLVSLDSCEELLSYDNLMKTFSEPYKFVSNSESPIVKNIEERKLPRSNIPVKTHVKINENIEMKNEIINIKKDSLTSDETLYENEECVSKVVKSESEIDTGKEIVVCKKINSMLLKITSILQEIRLLYQSGVLPVESPEDQIKREKRSFEFSTRISRNYLYQISRQIVDLNKHVRPGSSKNSSHHITLNQRFVNAHNVVIQALQAFCSYIPQSIISCVQNKFQELLMQILELCRLTRNFRNFYNIQSHYSVIEEVEKVCNTLIESFEKQTINEEIKTTVVEKVTPVEKKKIKKNVKKKPIKHRLAMYSTPLKSLSKGNIWEKNVEMLAKQRFNVQSRYKPGVYNPKPREKPVVHFLDKNVTAKQSSELKSTVSTHSCINDNDIPTMVQMEHDSQVSVENTETALAKTKTEVTMKLEPLLEKLVNQISTSKDEFMDQTNSNNVLDKLKGLLDQVQCLKSTPQHKQDVHNDQNVSDKKNVTNNKLIKPKSNVTITGEKNAQLICIKDKSCYDQGDGDEENNEDKNCNMAVERNEKKTDKHTFGMLPKKFAINIVQYKLDFHKFSKSNHMYKKTLLIQPWLLTSKLSDNLLDKLLFEVISEIELNEIVNKVYNAEFE